MTAGVQAGAVHAGVDLDLLAQVVQVSADAIYTEDLDGRLTSWNAAAERLYRRPAADALGTSAADLAAPASRDSLESVRARALAGDRVERLDAVHLRADGERLPVSLTVSPLRAASGEVCALATSVRDVGEATRLLAELEDAQRELERKQEVLLRSNRDLEQFAYVASHDLSEPLRVITGYVQLLEKRYTGVLDERGERYVKHVVEGCQRMRALIDDLLEYSRFLRVDRVLQPVDLRATADAVVASLGRQIEAVGANVEVGAMPPVRSDPSSASALLQNLVSNALKFTRPGQAPHVRVGGTRDGGSVVVTVDDDGIGIAPEFREKVFRMFQRLHVREEYGGTGIGLAVVSKVAEQAGGQVWIEDSPLGGARFCVRLPAAPPGPDAAPDRPEEP